VMTASAMIYSKYVLARIILTQVSGKSRPREDQTEGKNWATSPF
jgi:hypothetical protein